MTTHRELIHNNGVRVLDLEGYGGRFFCVVDENVEAVRVALIPMGGDGSVKVEISLKTDPDREIIDYVPQHGGPGMVNFGYDYTPAPFGGRGDFACGPDDVLSIDDTGLLTAMQRPSSRFPAHVAILGGCTVQLPVQYVEPVRVAIAKARQSAAKMKAAVRRA